MSASQFAKVIAESTSTHSEWSLVDGSNVVAHAIISGINPYFQTRREISHIIRLELPREFFKRRWDKVLFYGAGCSTPERNKIVESSLVAQFKTPVTVESDLVGAAHGLLQREAGLACILGAGSNSCFYDGEKITKSVTAGGFILGPMVQHEAFGPWWAGFPFDTDLTDNKTLISFLFFLLALATRKWKYNRWVVALAVMVMIAVFTIPHSTNGSEYNYETQQLTTGSN